MVTAGNITQGTGDEAQHVHFPTKKRALRITGIPNGKSFDDVKQVLQNDPEFSVVLNASKSASKLFLYPSVTPKFQVGILLLTVREDLLNEFVSGNAKRYITWDEEDIDISVDCHFQGLTPLNKCDEPVADLVAVTGLAGHAWGSWMHKQTRRMWLHDFLGKDNVLGSKIRIMTYGYDTELQNSSSSDTSVLDIVTGLLEDVQRARNGLKDSNRPLFFVCHSLGGIIVTKALANCSRHRYKEFKPISDATQLLVFFGVPHRGMEISDFRLMVAATKNGLQQKPESQQKRMSKILDSLEHDSHFLEEYQQEISTVLGPPRMVISLYETKLSPMFIETAATGSFSRAGEYIRRLQKYSSQTNLSNETPIPVDADHSNMAKFDHGDDRTYQTLLLRIHEVLKELTKDQSESNHPLGRPPTYTESIIEREIKDAVRNMRTTQAPVRQADNSEPLTKERPVVVAHPPAGMANNASSP